MLICNNCGSTNNPDAVACSHCRIESGFTKQPENDPKKAITETVMCINCGIHVGADLSRCPECRFPITKGRTTRNFTQQDHSVFVGNLKAG